MRPRLFCVFCVLSRIAICCYIIRRFWRAHVLDRQVVLNKRLPLLGGTQYSFRCFLCLGGHIMCYIIVLTWHLLDSKPWVVFNHLLIIVFFLLGGDSEESLVVQMECPAWCSGGRRPLIAGCNPPSLGFEPQTNLRPQTRGNLVSLWEFDLNDGRILWRCALPTKRHYRGVRNFRLERKLFFHLLSTWQGTR